MRERCVSGQCFLQPWLWWLEAAVILFDPIFQGLAISLMAGEIASLLISRMAVPVLYFVAHTKGKSHSVMS